MFNFPNISLLITHYNRSQSLKRLLLTFKVLQCNFGEIIVSDDYSSFEHQIRLKKLQEEFEFRLVLSEHNRGLGNNINKGQKTVTKPYTLYIQEDFVPQRAFPEKLLNGLSFLDNDRELDIVRFYAYSRYPYLTNFENGFSRMHMRKFGLRYKKVHYYSDHPHLRRSTFLDKFGEYSEGAKSDVTEYNMSVAFIRNNGKGIFYNDHYSLLTQVNSTEEPSTIPLVERKRKTDFLSKVFRLIFRQIKYNYDISLRNMKTQ